MLDELAARRMAQQELDSHGFEGGLVITKVTEITEGWVFFYTSATYQQSRDFRDALVANAPIIVDRTDGTLHHTGTAHEIDFYVDQYRKTKAWNLTYAHEPWFVPDKTQAAGVLKEALTEIEKGHPLFSKRISAKLCCAGCDRAVFEVEGWGHAIVHLTWTRTSEQPPWPQSEMADTSAALVRLLDAHEH